MYRGSGTDPNYLLPAFATNIVGQSQQVGHCKHHWFSHHWGELGYRNPVGCQCWLERIVTRDSVQFPEVTDGFTLGNHRMGPTRQAPFSSHLPLHSPSSSCNLSELQHQTCSACAWRSQGTWHIVHQFSTLIGYCFTGQGTARIPKIRRDQRSKRGGCGCVPSSKRPNEECLLSITIVEKYTSYD